MVLIKQPVIILLHILILIALIKQKIAQTVQLITSIVITILTVIAHNPTIKLNPTMIHQSMIPRTAQLALIVQILHLLMSLLLAIILPHAKLRLIKQLVIQMDRVAILLHISSELVTSL